MYFANYFTCPRRVEDGTVDGPFTYAGENIDTYRVDDTCSYCGSYNPFSLMERLEKGDVSVTPTDKNYKVYVGNEGGENFEQTYREEGKLITRQRPEIKFYFQHFSEDQRKRFIELANEKKLRLNEPGRFYVMPFFMRSL